MKLKELFNENFFGSPANVWYPSLNQDGTINAEKNNSNLDSVPGDARVNDSNITNLTGCPKEVGKDFDIRQCHKLSSLRGAPDIVHGNVKIEFCPYITSLEGIGKDYLKEIGIGLKISKAIKFNILGILKVKKLQFITTSNLSGDLREAVTIINNHLEDRDIVKCRQELIDAGLKEFAKL